MGKDTKQINLSVCVLSFNEQNTIERCLKSALFANEVIVVDSGSSDKTLEIAKRYANKIEYRKWSGFSDQRNFALSLCTNTWVFFVDADEEVSMELAAKIMALVSDNHTNLPNCISIKRIEYFLDKRLDFGPGNPSFQWRLFRKSSVNFKGEVHEYPQFEGDVGVIASPENACLHHNPDLDIDRFLKKLNHYTTLEALDRFAQGEKTSLFHAFGTFFSTFLKNGVRYQGFRNGKEGFVLVILESFSRVSRHLKLWNLWRKYEDCIRLGLKWTGPVPNSSSPPPTSELEKPQIEV